MTDSERNRKSIKGNEEEDCMGNINIEVTSYRKLSDNLKNPPCESISTADNTSDPKYSGTNKRVEDKNNDDTVNDR